MGGIVMKNLLKFLLIRLKCFWEGHDWYYSKYADYWFCKRCGKATMIPY